MAQVKHKPGYYTYRDYRCWPENERWELLDGAAYLMSPAPNWLHQEVLMEVARQLGNQLKGHRCRLAIAPLDVRLPHNDEADELVDTVVQPDLLIVCDARQIVADGVRGAPAWVLEVLSPGTASYDHVHKRRIYERAGVAEFWLLHPLERLLTIYRMDGTSYGAAEILEASGKQALNCVPLHVDFAQVFVGDIPES